MPKGEGGGTSLVPERFYITGEQEKIYQSEADERGISKSEYYRRMIQAGRRELGIAKLEDSKTGQTAQRPANQNTVLEGDLRERILQVLDEGRRQAKDYEDFTNEVVGDIETDIGNEVADLQAEGRVVIQPGIGIYLTENAN